MSGTLEISWRLKGDACELLGRLRAEEAIHLLIWFSEDEMVDVDPKQKWYPEMRALVEIGSNAVPKLVQAIHTAETKAGAKRAEHTLTTNEGMRPRIIELDKYRIQSRCVLVLGEIGDTRALPVLEELLRTSGNEYLMRAVRESIQKIHERQRARGRET